MTSKVISQLFYYPIKSCQGIAVSSLEIENLGPKSDREWMIVDEQGQFMTQRQHPQMSLIKVGWDDSKNLWLQTPLQAEKILIPSAENQQNSSTPSTQLPTQLRKVKVWGDEVMAQVSFQASEYLSDFLSQKVNLVRFGHQQRPENADGSRTRFADKYPLLVLGTASWQDLNQRLQSQGATSAVAIENFRANVIIETQTPYEEDHWDEFQVSSASASTDGLKLKMVKPCARCVMVDVDFTKGQPGQLKVLKTLASYRKVDNKVYFAMNAKPILNSGESRRIQVGDRVRVIE